MNQLSDNYVYSDGVIRFVTSAVEVCILLEHISELTKRELVDKLLQKLPVLYSNTVSLPQPEQVLEGMAEQHVTEDEYNYIARQLEDLFGPDNAYLEVFVEDMRYSDEPITEFLSENLADIYQELRDMALNYQTQMEEIMNDSIYTCLQNFKLHWGQKLLNALKALHMIYLNDTDEDQ